MNAFGHLNPKILGEISSIVGNDHIFTDSESLQEFSHDHTEDLRYLPHALVFPGSAAEVAAVLGICNTHLIPVTAAGARTGLSGGMLPAHGGISLSTRRLNRIIDIDTQNLQITVEPGVITQAIQNAVAEHGLYYPPDPASRGSCTVGGNLAECSGGPHAVKYGITRDYVLDLEVALADGNLIRTGARVLKNSTGYSLTHLMIGSEGTLGVITKAVLKLVPLPRYTLTLLAPFRSSEDACASVSAIFRAGITPAALEFMERDAIDFAQQYLGLEKYNLEGIEAHLLIEIDGNHLPAMQEEAETIAEVLSDHECQDILYADSAEQQADLWRIRRVIGEAVKKNSIYKEEDTVVPRAELPELLSFVKHLGMEYGFRSICYGHAGDGNLHVNILRDQMTDEDWKIRLPEAIRKLFVRVKELGGTISGEHGIGLVQRPYMDIMFSEIQLNIMRNIKRAFDPNGILNPGKILP